MSPRPELLEDFTVSTLPEDTSDPPRRRCRRLEAAGCLTNLGGELLVDAVTSLFHRDPDTQPREIFLNLTQITWIEPAGALGLLHAQSIAHDHNCRLTLHHGRSSDKA